MRRAQPLITASLPLAVRTQRSRPESATKDRLPRAPAKPGKEGQPKGPVRSGGSRSRRRSGMRPKSPSPEVAASVIFHRKSRLFRGMPLSHRKELTTPFLTSKVVLLHVFEILSFFSPFNVALRRSCDRFSLQFFSIPIIICLS